MLHGGGGPVWLSDGVPGAGAVDAVGAAGRIFPSADDSVRLRP